MHKLFLGCLLAAACSGVLGGEAPPVADDPALEKHVMAISEVLRCLVCQNQTIADSHAELAVDLRNQVREQIQQGKSDQDVLDYMVQRYGDFVLYRPPVKGSTWLLWFGPFLLLGAGALALLLRLRRRRAPAAALPQGEMERAAHLLDATTELKETR